MDLTSASSIAQSLRSCAGPSIAAPFGVLRTLPQKVPLNRAAVAGVMCKSLLKQAVAPSLASRGIMQYWRGNYKKAHQLLARAQDWSPYLFENSEFQGYLGLSLFRIGRVEQSIPLMAEAIKNAQSIRQFNSDVRSVQDDMIAEIKAILGKAKT